MSGNTVSVSIGGQISIEGLGETISNIHKQVHLGNLSPEVKIEMIFPESKGLATRPYSRGGPSVFMNLVVPKEQEESTEKLISEVLFE